MIGMSTYSLARAFAAGEMTVSQALPWMAERGAAHVEVVPIGFALTKDDCDRLRSQAAEAKLFVSNYAISANFLLGDEEAQRVEVERVKQEVHLAHALGAKRMRHDVAWRPATESGIADYARALPALVAACRDIAEYAAALGVVTSVENHGYFVQHSDRVLQLVEAVDHPNFRMTIDIGNFLCVDEDPVAAVRKCLPVASMIHVKDFYVRRQRQSPGKGFFQTAGGHWLRGAIVGQGDLPVATMLRDIRASGYEGDISVEFEGIEEPLMGAEESLNHVLHLWEQAGR